MKLKTTVTGLFLGAALFLGGCAGQTAQPLPGETAQQTQLRDMQANYLKACTAYSAAFSSAVQARANNMLSPSQIAAISVINQQVSPMCQGTLPTDPVAVTQKVTAAVTTLGVIGVVKAVSK